MQLSLRVSAEIATQYFHAVVDDTFTNVSSDLARRIFATYVTEEQLDKLYLRRILPKQKYDQSKYKLYLRIMLESWIHENAVYELQ